MPVSSATVVTSGEPPSITTTTTTAEAPTITTATVSSVEPVTSVISSGEVPSSSRESSASSHQEQPQPSSQEPSAIQTIQPPPAALKSVKVTSASGIDSSVSPSVNIVKMRHPTLATVGAYSSRVTIKRRRAEEDDMSTDQEGSSVDNKKLKQDVEVKIGVCVHLCNSNIYDILAVYVGFINCS